MGPARALSRRQRRRGVEFAGRVGRVALVAILALLTPALVGLRGGAATTGALPASLLTVRLNGAVVPDAAANLPLTQDIAFGTTYSVCCSATVTSKTFSAGWSIATLITAAGAAPSNIASVRIERRSGGTGVTLLPPDFDPATPGGLDFPQSSCSIVGVPAGGAWTCPALVYLSMGGRESLNFFRPERAANPPDDNFSDWIESPDGTGLTIDIVGPHLDVSATADRTQVRVGQSVRFSASAISPVVGEQLAYSWSLSDGSTLEGASVTHVFASPGTYQAIAQVTGTSDSAGASAPITLVVGKQPGAPGPGGATSTTLPPTSGGSGGGPVTPSTITTSPTSTTTVPVNAQSPDLPSQGAATGSVARRRPLSTSKARPVTAPVTARATAPGETLVRGDLLAGSASIASHGVVETPAVKRATGAGGTSTASPRHWLAPTLGFGTAAALYCIGAASERPRRRLRRKLSLRSAHLHAGSSS